MARILQPQQLSHIVQLAQPGSSSSSDVSWPRTAAIVLSSLWGVGTLALPAAFQRLGWIPALSVLTLSALMAAYSGSLYARLLSSLPWVSTYHELGSRALHHRVWGTLLVAGTAYAAIFLTPVILHLASAQALQQVFPQGEAPSVFLCGFLITCVVLPLAQIRQLAQVSVLGAVSSCFMGMSVVLVVWKLCFADPPPPEGAHTALVEHVGLYPALVGALNIVFVFSGQESWVRYLSAMGPYRRHFTWSAWSAVGVMTPFVGAVGGAGYATRGGTLDLSAPVTRALVPDTTARVIAGGVLLAVTVAYVVHINVAAQTLLEVCAPALFKQTGHPHHIPPSAHPGNAGDMRAPLLARTPAHAPAEVREHAAGAAMAPPPQPVRVQLLVQEGAGPEQAHMHVSLTSLPQPPANSPESSDECEGDDQPSHHHSAHGDEGTTRLLWALASVSFVLGGWLLGSLFPKFSELEGVIASLGAISAMMGLPALFAVQLLPLHRIERVVCMVLVGLSVLLTATGLWVSVSELRSGTGS